MSNEQIDRPIPQYDRSINEQDRFLDYCQRNEILIKVYLDSGRALQGKIVDHDRKCILLGATRVEKIPKMIPKSYIALVRAEEILPLFLEYKGRGNFITRKKARKAKKRAEQGSKSTQSRPRKPRPAKSERGLVISTPTPVSPPMCPVVNASPTIRTKKKPLPPSDS